jgi:hypothetical protein
MIAPKKIETGWRGAGVIPIVGIVIAVWGFVGGALL